MELAQVIVDVPTSQTDTPYTYKVPKTLANLVEPGMRVIVPFGRRRIEGFIVNFIDKNPNDFKFKLKYISGLMDLSPVVNTELLQLSEWMAKSTFAFRISCLMAMLPTAMKAKYRTELTLTQPVKNKTIQNLFQGQKSFIYNPKKLMASQARLFLKLRHEGKARVKYLVKNQAKGRKVPVFYSLLKQNQIQKTLKKVRKNATKQIALLYFLQKQPNKQTYSVKFAHSKDSKIDLQTVKEGQKKGWVRLFRKNQYRNPYKYFTKDNYPFVLNSEQHSALKHIVSSINQEQAKTYLLEGVTGSGKTEIYLQAIEQALKQNKTALMLVPEITLTPQMVNWIKGRFGNLAAVLHSRLSTGERYDEWRRINNEQAKVVIGVRSAVFAPLKNIGVIIVDEEHDTSYKQETNPRYQAKLVAEWRAKYNHCPVVLGSATPSLVSRAKADNGTYQMLRLSHRVNNQVMPKIHIVNMREAVKIRHYTNYSIPLLNAIRERIKRHEQTVLMLNRRGYSSFVICETCGYVPKCPNCDISLTLHLNSRKLKCHYCGYETPIPNKCPKCGSNKIRYLGSGTEKAEQELERLIPGIKVIRMDVDTTTRRGSHAKLLHAFRKGKANVLLGTQMIAKGLDFPNVTLVGVLNADTTLNLPSYRAPEETYQLLTQVSGRAGRANKKGEVYIQTFDPDNPVIKLAKQQNYEKFYQYDIKNRKRINYPPFCHIIRIASTCRDKIYGTIQLLKMKNYLTPRLSSTTVILGPSPSEIDKIKNQYFYQMVLKYKSEPRLQRLLAHVMNYSQKHNKKGLRIAINPNPTNTI